jgi:hypothetical protein
MTAVVPALWFQAEMVPFRLAKMKAAGVPPSWKDVPVLLTWLVGPCGPVDVVGMATVRGFLMTFKLPVVFKLPVTA